MCLSAATAILFPLKRFGGEMQMQTHCVHRPHCASIELNLWMRVLSHCYLQMWLWSIQLYRGHELQAFVLVLSGGVCAKGLIHPTLPISPVVQRKSRQKLNP